MKCQDCPRRMDIGDPLGHHRCGWTGAQVMASSCGVEDGPDPDWPCPGTLGQLKGSPLKHKLVAGVLAQIAQRGLLRELLKEYPLQTRVWLWQLWRDYRRKLEHTS